VEPPNGSAPLYFYSWSNFLIVMFRAATIAAFALLGLVHPLARVPFDANTWFAHLVRMTNFPPLASQFWRFAPKTDAD